MQTIIPRLHASAPELLGFGPSLERLRRGESG
jgi:hypothetical protein